MNNYPEAYIAYLVHFHGDRDYFECHEVLEEYWKEETPQERNSHWVGLIQIAVALYHFRRKNMNGALKTINKAHSLLINKKKEIDELGIEHSRLLHILNEIEDRMKKKLPYESVNLPLNDPGLAAVCRHRCESEGFVWGGSSNMGASSLVNRHKTRDRTDIILERERQLQLRKEKPYP
ncbi:DUF309 domain-containing protein [Peribacillus sp. SCS-155]|uniref:DUF309 domain-containing protein n=1 Tax=Peribacillus sedimenti TaxID=3115297 RepID=UPI003905E9CF